MARRRRGRFRARRSADRGRDAPLPYCHGWEVRRGIPAIDGLVARLSVVDDRLDAVQLTDGRSIPRTVVFIRPALHARNDGLIDALGCEVDEGGFLRVDATGGTTIPGVWASGNAANPRAQVITAAGEGSAAAIAINAHLVEEYVHNSLKATEGVFR